LWGLVKKKQDIFIKQRALFVEQIIALANKEQVVNFLD